MRSAPAFAAAWPLLAGALACALAPLSGCVATGPDGAPADRPDLGDADLPATGAPADLGPRPRWRALSPTPEDDDLWGIAGVLASDYYVVTGSAVVYRQAGSSRVLFRVPGAPCLRGVLFVQGDLVAVGGCRGLGLLAERRGGADWSYRELDNLELSAAWAERRDEVYLASPGAGVVRLRKGQLHLERTVPRGAEGSGPVALWGAGADSLYAAGHGRVLHRLGDDRWEVVRERPDETQLGLWGPSGDDFYVVGAQGAAGAIWHKAAGGPFFLREPIAVPTSAVVAVWGSGKDDVYAAADGGLVLRRDAGNWVADRPGAPAAAQPALRALWGPDRDTLFAVGPAGILRRDPLHGWQAELGQALTGATLRAAALSPEPPGDGVVVGDAGVILARRDGRFQREAAPPATAALHGVALLPDGDGAYAVGDGGTVLLRRGGVWMYDRAPDRGAPALYAVQAAPDGTVYAVGEQGRILARRGEGWQPETPPRTASGAPFAAPLRALAVLADGTVLAAGDQGALLARPAGAASFRLLRHDPESALRFTGLRAFSGASGEEAWGCADQGAWLLRYRNGRTELRPSPITDATAIYGRRPADLYLSSRSGRVWHFGGAAWQPEPTPQTEALLALAGAGAEVLAVGAQGFVIERP